MQNVGTKTQTFEIALQTTDVVSVLESTLVTMQLFTETGSWSSVFGLSSFQVACT